MCCAHDTDVEIPHVSAERLSNGCNPGCLPFKPVIKTLIYKKGFIFFCCYVLLPCELIFSECNHWLQKLAEEACSIGTTR